MAFSSIHIDKTFVQVLIILRLYYYNFFLWL